MDRLGTVRQKEESKMTGFPIDGSLVSNYSSGDGEKWVDPGRDGRMRVLSKVGL